MTSFTGIWVPLVTPFRNGEIDFNALQALAKRVSAAGVSGLIACGSTGEAAALDEAEQLAVLDAIIDAVPDRPVAMGLSGNNMKAVLAKQQKIATRRVAGLLATAPYYIRPSLSGIVEYFRTLADASPIPIILYDIPYRTGATITLDTFRTLAQHERIVALKDCGGDAAKAMSLIADGELNLLAGEDAQVFTTLCLGGAGAILASPHIRPDLFVSMFDCVRAQRLEEAREIFYRLLPMIRVIYEEPNPGPLKAALAMMGEMSDELRAPMQAASAETKEKLKRELTRLECL
jgi:4-hydroxy-tetrahydrodipicolinate synthase